MPNKDIYEMSDKAIAAMIGQRIEQIRLERNISQGELAGTVGISPKTYRKLVDEGGKLETLIAVLRVLDRLELADTFIPQESISPLELVKLKGQERRRASRKPTISRPNDPLVDENAELDW
jgi:transcriptional regulator with XRE-family HTH domain